MRTGANSDSFASCCLSTVGREATLMLRDARYTERVLAQARHTSYYSKHADEEDNGGDDTGGDDNGSDGPEVVWSSPKDGQTFAPGDTIVGTWSSDDDVPSPSFSLCVSEEQGSDSSDSGCGETVYPHVRETNSGSSTMSLTVPHVNSAGQFYLMMEDDDGYEYKSPVFSLLPAATTTTTSATASYLSTVSGAAATSSISLPGPAGPTNIPTAVNLASHPQPSTVALAIPLSLIGAIMVAALGMCCCKWRRSVKKREQAPHTFAPGASTYPFSGYGAANASLPLRHELTNGVGGLSAAQMCSTPSRNPFLVPQLSQLGHGRSTFAEDKYTARRERSRRVSRNPSELSDYAKGPLMAPRIPSRGGHSLRPGPSFESFPSDNLDYGKPLTSAPQTTRRSRTKGGNRGEKRESAPFLARPLSYGRRDNEEPEYKVDADETEEEAILDAYMQPSPALAPERPPRVICRPRARPHSGDSMAYRLPAHDDPREGDESPDVYYAVSEAIRKYA